MSAYVIKGAALLGGEPADRDQHGGHSRQGARRRPQPGSPLEVPIPRHPAWLSPPSHPHSLSPAPSRVTR